MSNNTEWVAVQTIPRKEMYARDALRESGYEVFLPTYRPNRASRSSNATDDRPLFPGYLFCMWDSTPRVRIVSAPCVRRIVSFGDKPAFVPQCEIQGLQTLVKTGAPSEPWKYLPEGTLVQVKSGPMKNVWGTIIKDADATRLILSVHLLSRSTAVVLDENTELLVHSGTRPTDDATSRTAIALLKN